MRVIWKYPIAHRGWTSIPIGPDAKIILAGLDPESGGVSLWIEHEHPVGAREPCVDAGPIRLDLRYFAIMATGEELWPNYEHVGSVIDRTFVWHICLAHL